MADGSHIEIAITCHGLSDFARIWYATAMSLRRRLYDQNLEPIVVIRESGLTIIELELELVAERATSNCNGVSDNGT